MKNWKSLFVRTDEEESAPSTPQQNDLSFPVNQSAGSSFNNSMPPPTAQPVNDPMVQEVLKVYENGLDSINMPGYDFYEFYQSINGAGYANEQTYSMAFNMAKTLDKTITAQKLVNDAEFYISKINEVHQQYIVQGQQKLNMLQDKKNVEKQKLNAEINAAEQRITQLRAELQQLEGSISKNRGTLARVEESYAPTEREVKDKLHANDVAWKASSDKLNVVKEGILRYVK